MQRRGIRCEVPIKRSLDTEPGWWGVGACRPFVIPSSLCGPDKMNNESPKDTVQGP